MPDEWLISTVHTTTSHVHGRTLNSARNHHWVIDGPARPGEEVYSMESFLAGISSCAVHLFQDFADEEGLPLEWASVAIQAVRPGNEPNRFDHIDLDVEMGGVSREQAEHLIERFKGR